MANVKFFTQGDHFYIADKGGEVVCYKQVSAIADALINICRSQNVPHGPNDSNRELVDKILEQCGGFSGDPDQARVTVKLGKMIDAPINTYHILRTETGEFYVLSPIVFYANIKRMSFLGGYSDSCIVYLAARVGIKKYIDMLNELNKLSGDDRSKMAESLRAQYHVYDVFCEIYDFINSRK